MAKTSKDIVEVCEQVLAARAAKKKTITINGSTFNFSDVGLCQKNARLVYEAVTGEPMPHKSCCAGRTLKNLLEHPEVSLEVLHKPWSSAVKKIRPGDFLYFDGGNLHSCGIPVGHVGIWLGDNRMFQNTSRKVNDVPLGTTDAGITEDQKKRFVAAFRFLPLPEQQPVPPPTTPQVWQFTPVKDGSGDITCTGRATQFNDKVTRTGVPANRPGLLGVALPRGLVAATKGSGFEGVPDFALVRIYCHKTKKTIWATVIDEGPGWVAQAGTGHPGGGMIDLSIGAAIKLGLNTDENADVSIRIFAGSEQVVMQGKSGMWIKG